MRQDDLNAGVKEIHYAARDSECYMYNKNTLYPELDRIFKNKKQIQKHLIRMIRGMQS